MTKIKSTRLVSRDWEKEQDDVSLGYNILSAVSQGMKPKLNNENNGSAKEVIASRVFEKETISNSKKLPVESIDDTAFGKDSFKSKKERKISSYKDLKVFRSKSDRKHQKNFVASLDHSSNLEPKIKTRVQSRSPSEAKKIKMQRKSTP